ncbi:MAG: type II secretion system protein [Candidatus Aminicenantes bacterium]|nr:type II secretion system protein [Candidatus Aminicenantes bacterium]
MIQKRKGYTLLILLFAVSVISIGLLVAVPVWKTQIQRENEEELIFRGKQYIEAVRLYQLKKPGQYPKTLEELVEEKCLRRLYRDPMSHHGEWNIILPYQRGATAAPRRQEPSQKNRQRQGEAGRTDEQSFQKVYIVPLSALPAVDNPAVIGVVSSSTEKAFKIYLNESSYDKWLFFYGMDPQNMPEIVYFGQEEQD